MRFASRPRCEYIVTHRKRLAAARWQQRQRDCFPLLGLLIAQTQLSIDDVMDRRVQCWLSRSKQIVTIVPGNGAKRIAT
jgi:hypothetical protein